MVSDYASSEDVLHLQRELLDVFVERAIMPRRNIFKVVLDVGW